MQIASHVAMLTASVVAQVKLFIYRFGCAGEALTLLLIDSFACTVSKNLSNHFCCADEA